MKPHVKGALWAMSSAPRMNSTKSSAIWLKRALSARKASRCPHGDGLGVHQPIRLDETWKWLPVSLRFDHLHTADLDDAVPR